MNREEILKLLSSIVRIFNSLYLENLTLALKCLGLTISVILCQSFIAFSIYSLTKVFELGRFEIFGVVLADEVSVGVIFSVVMIAASLVLTTLFRFWFSVRLREFGRASHIRLLNAYCRDVESNRTVDMSFTDKKVNQLINQGTLQGGIITEQVFQAGIPIALILSGLFLIVRADPTSAAIFLITVALGTSILVGLARSISSQSRRFHAETAAVLSVFINRWRNSLVMQNLVKPETKMDFTNLEDTSSFFNDYDAMILANDRMQMTVGLLRTCAMVLVAIYVSWAAFNGNISTGELSLVIVGAYLLGNGAISLSSIVASIVRLLPQAMLAFMVIVDEAEADPEFRDSTDSADFSNPSKAYQSGKPGSDKQPKTLIYLFSSKPIDLRMVRICKQNSERLHLTNHGKKIKYVSEHYYPTETSLKQLYLGAENTFNTLHEKSFFQSIRIDHDELITDAFWDGLDGEQRNFLKILPLLSSDTIETAMLGYDCVGAFPSDQRDEVLASIQSRTLIINVFNLKPTLRAGARIFELQDEELIEKSAEWADNWVHDSAASSDGTLTQGGEHLLV